MQLAAVSPAGACLGRMRKCPDMVEGMELKITKR